MTFKKNISIFVVVLFFLIVNSTSLTAQSITAATGGTGISADNVGGAYTTLTGPIITEASAGQISLGFIDITVPTGFRWNTAATPTVTVTLAPGLNGQTKLQASYVSITATRIRVQVTQTSDNGGNRAGRITLGNVQVRPTSGVFPNTGNITNAGTSAPGGTTNYGSLSIVKGAASKIRVETASNGTGSVISAQNLTAGNSLTGYSISRDQFNNFLQNIVAGAWSITNPIGSVETSDLTIAGDSKSATLSSNLVGSGNIQATQGALTPTTSGKITVVHSTASALVIGTEPSTTATAGSAFSQQPVIKIVDVYGNTVTSDNTTQISAARNLGSGNLQGTTSKTVVLGVATYTNLSHNVANSIKIEFSSAGFSSITSAQIDVSAAAAAALEFTVQPPNGSKNSTLVPSPEVQIVDVYGNSVLQSGTTINMTIASGPSTFTNSATTSVVTNASGTAVFNNLALKANGAYTIQATDNLSVLTPVTSGPFTIVSAGTLSNFVVEISGGGSVPSQTAGASFTIDITAVDGVGNTLDGGGARDDFNGKAFITVPGNTGTGVNDSTISFISGIASHTLTLETAGNFSISATRGEISTPSNTFDVVPGAPSIVTSEVDALPSSIVADGSSTSLISVKLKDAFGNFLTSGGDAVVISSTAGTLLSTVTDNADGTYEQFLQSTTTVDSAFISATVNAASISSVDTVVFVPGGLDKFAVEAAGGGAISTQNAGTSFDILITAQDVNGNTVTSFNGNVSLTSNKTVSSGDGTQSLSNGILDNHTITITGAGVGDATITATNTSGSQTGTSTAFTINPDVVDPTVTTISSADRFIENDGASTTLITVQAKDQFGNNLISGGSTVLLTTTAGTLQGSVSDNANGTYTQTLQSSILVGEATITGIIDLTSITDDAKVFIAEFNEWTSGGGGGSNPTNWSRGGNWTLGVPTTNQAIIIPTTPTGAVKFPILDTSPTVAFLQIESGASLNADPGFTITITGSLSGNGSLILDNSTATIGGDISINNLNAGNSTVVLNGTDEQTVDGNIVSNILTISNSGTGVVVNGYVNADTQLEVTSGSIFTLATGSTMEIFGDLIGAGTVNTSNSDIIIGGDVSLVNATFSTSDILLNGIALQTIDSEFTYSNLDVTNTSGAGVVFENNTTITNTLNLITGSNTQVNGTLTANTLIASGANIGIAGNLNVVTLTSAPNTVEFNGTTKQLISSFDSFTNLTVNKSSSELVSEDDLEISGTLTLTQGDLVIGSGKNLIAPTKTITSGQIRFLRELTSRGWHLISSPVNATFDNLLDSVTTQGYAGSTLGIEYLNVPGDSLQPNVLYYDETFVGNDLQRWRVPSNATNNVAEGVGYFVFVFGDIAADARYNNVLPDTLDVGGTEFTGSGTSVDFGVTYTATADTGWNLIGNPYGATLDWDDSGNWTKTNIDNTIYVWDKTANGGNGEYLVWNGLIGSLGNGLIAPFQGFWVKANATSPSLIVNSDIKTTGGVFRKAVKKEKDELEDLRDSPSLGFRLSTDGLEKESFIMFSEQGLNGKDNFDAYQLEPFTDSYLELYTKHKDGNPLVINHLPRRFGKEIEIPIYVDAFKNGSGFSGAFSISLSSAKNIPSSWIIKLENLSNGSEEIIKEGDTINFSFNSFNSKTKAKSGFAVKQSKPDSDPQFLLKIQPGEDAIGIPNKFRLNQNYPNPFNPSTTFVFDLPVQSPVSLEVYDILGRKVASVINNTTFQAGSHDFLWDASSLASGIYIYRMITSEGSLLQKMTLIK